MNIRSFFIALTVLTIATFTSKAQQAPIDLYATSALGTDGDIVNLDVKVNKFTDIIAFQASLNWDPSVLKYTGVSNFGIKDFGESDFGTTSADQGHVRFLWEPNDAIALSIADSSVLFSVQFEIVANTDQTVSIGFVDNISADPFPIEFAEFVDPDYNELTVNTYPGEIIIYTDPKDLVNILSSPFTSCDEKVNNGSLKADVNGDSTSFIFHWFNGSSVGAQADYIGFRYDKIPAGVYTLQILDESNQVFVESMTASVLDESIQNVDKISVISNVPQTSCSTDPAKQTGVLEININDAQQTDLYLISWWEDAYETGLELTALQNLYKAENLNAGSYEVAVENKSNGCKTYLVNEISEILVVMQPILTTTKNNFCKDGANGSATVFIDDLTNLNPHYFWFDEGDPIDTTSAKQKGKIYENLKAGNYTTFVIDINSECSATQQISVVDSLITSDAEITQIIDTLFANDASANWFRNDIDLQIAGPYLIPETSGSYSISITNEFGCFSESLDFYYGITGLDEFSKEINIYPNPFTDYIRISNEEAYLDFIKVFDAKGKLISEKYAIKDKFIDLYLSGSSNGIYFLKVSKNGKILTRKVVKNLP